MWGEKLPRPQNLGRLLQFKDHFAVDKNKKAIFSRRDFLVAALERCFPVDKEKSQCVGSNKTTLI